MKAVTHNFGYKEVYELCSASLFLYACMCTLECDDAQSVVARANFWSAIKQIVPIVDDSGGLQVRRDQ